MELPRKESTFKYSGIIGFTTGTIEKVFCAVSFVSMFQGTLNSPCISTSKSLLGLCVSSSLQLFDKVLDEDEEPKMADEDITSFINSGV